MARFLIEAYAYSVGPSDGTLGCDFADAQTLGCTDAGGTFYARPDAPMAFLDLIAYWAAALSASLLNGNYTLSFDAETNTVTIATTNAVNFTPIFPANSAVFLGFSPQTFIAAQAFVSDLQPLGCIAPHSMELDLRTDTPQIGRGDFRHGRIVPIVFGNFKTITGTIYLGRRQLALASAGWMRGRVRISTIAVGLANAYDLDHLDGWFDAQCFKWPKPERIANGTNLRLPLTFAVKRSDG